MKSLYAPSGRSGSGIDARYFARVKHSAEDTAHLLASSSNEFVALDISTPKAGNTSHAVAHHFPAGVWYSGSISGDGKGPDGVAIIKAGGTFPKSQAANLQTASSERSSVPQYSEEELMQTDRMINHMLMSYVALLTFGWGLLFFDWAVNELEKHPKAEPWINDAVTIGGASAVLSPIIQWGHCIVYTNPLGNEISRVRRRFYICMWSLYCSIVGLSTLVAVVRFILGEDGTLHHFISTTSNHLVLARISASLINWGSGKVFIRWYRQRLATGPLF